MPDPTPVPAPPTAQMALEALNTLCDSLEGFRFTAGEHTVRAFIEQAAAEGEAWAKLEAWRLRDPHRSEYALETDIHKSLRGQAFQCFATRSGTHKAFSARTRLEALQLAAAWCEKEGSR